MSFYDLALELGVMVVGEDLPPDLSTNPDYLEGLENLAPNNLQSDLI